MQQIFPLVAGHVDNADADLDVLYGSRRPAIAGRPWVGLCMITGIDGSTVVDGASGALGAAGDHAVFMALRRAADVIVVGSGTVAAEHYGPPGRDGQRVGVVTASGHVDTSTDLFRSGAGFLITTEDGPAAHGGVDVVRAGRGAVDLAGAMARLGEVAGDVRFVQAEGGPRLNGTLAAAGVIDEVNLTLAPTLTGGDGPRLTVGAPELLRPFTPAHVLIDDDGYLFTRWVRSDVSGPGAAAMDVSPAAP